MDLMKKPKVICLTPVRNDSWILDRFLKTASLWADHIIIADQNSTDNSKNICEKYEKVILIDNPFSHFSEYEMRTLLLNESRKIEGKHVLIYLDSDEILTPNFDSVEWDTIVNAKEGTMFLASRVNFKKGMNDVWSEEDYIFGFIDDGSDYDDFGLIHKSRVPKPEKRYKICLNDVKILHFQFTDWQRMLSKHRWFNCFEKFSYKNKSVVDIFRIYNYVKHIQPKKTLNIRMDSYVKSYSKYCVDITSVNSESLIWYEKLVLDYMDQCGTKFFSHLNIWDVNWVSIAEKWDYPNPEKYKDPRNKLEKLINRWLISTQSKKNNFWIVQLDKILKLFYK